MATISDINAEARSLVDADSVSLTDAVLLRRVNQAIEETVGKLIALDQTQIWGDSNFTSLPTGLVTMVNSQEGYQLSGNQSSTGVDTTNPLLTFLGASVKDKSGIWHTLDPIDLWDLFNIYADPAEYFKTDGIPQYYEIREDFIVLYPAPDNGVSVTLSSGLKIFYERRPSLFTAAQVSTGTKEPGFNPLYHYLLSYKMALPYALSYKKDRVPMLMNEIKRMETELLHVESKKIKKLGQRSIMTPKKDFYI